MNIKLITFYSMFWIGISIRGMDTHPYKTISLTTSNKLQLIFYANYPEGWINKITCKCIKKPTAGCYFLSDQAYHPEQNILAYIKKTDLRVKYIKDNEDFLCITNNPRDGEAVITKPEHYPLCVAINPDGTIVAGGYRKTPTYIQKAMPTIQLYDTRTGILIRQGAISDDYVSAIVFSPDGKTIASGSKNGVIKLHDSKTLKKLAQLTLHTQAITALAYNSSGNKLVSASEDKNITVWNLETNLLQQVNATRTPQAVAFHPNKPSFFSFEHKEVRFWKTN